MTDNGTSTTLWSVLITSGAAAGYLSLIWNFWNARVRLTLLAEYTDIGGAGITFTVSNRGSRPTTLTQIVVKEAARRGSLRSHNIGGNPGINDVALPVRLDQGGHWSACVFLSDFEAEVGNNQEAIRREESRRNTLSWLKDESIIGSSAVLMHFSHRARPYRLRIRPDADISIGLVDAFKLWWSSKD
jgi:hypothetical protein